MDFLHAGQIHFQPPTNARMHITNISHSLTFPLFFLYVCLHQRFHNIHLLFEIHGKLRYFNWLHRDSMEHLADF